MGRRNLLHGSLTSPRIRNRFKIVLRPTVFPLLRSNLTDSQSTRSMRWQVLIGRNSSGRNTTRWLKTGCPIFIQWWTNSREGLPINQGSIKMRTPIIILPWLFCRWETMELVERNKALPLTMMTPNCYKLYCLLKEEATLVTKKALRKLNYN